MKGLDCSFYTYTCLIYFISIFPVAYPCSPNVRYIFASMQTVVLFLGLVSSYINNHWLLNTVKGYMKIHRIIVQLHLFLETC